MRMIYNFKEAGEDEKVLNLQNRAFLYGDGLFETMICHNGAVRFLNDHWQRLTEGCQVLKLILPAGLNPEYLTTIAQTAQPWQSLRIRLQVWRKSGGFYTPQNNEADFCITLMPFTLPLLPVKEKIVFVAEPVLYFSGFSRFKTCNSLPYILAGIAKTAAGADDVILTDTNGYIAECSSSNIFWIKNNTLFTPHLQTGCIEGIMRKQVLKAAGEQGLQTEEGLFRRESVLKDVTIAFTTNVTGIYQIKQIEDYMPDRNNLPEWLLKLHES